MEILKYLVIIIGGIGKFFGENWQAIISSLSGTFLGAYLAFRFQRHYSDQKDRDAMISAAKQAQFSLLNQLTAAMNVKQQILDPQREDSNRHLTLTPFSVLPEYQFLDVTSLAFMLKGDGAQLLYKMMIAENQFRTFVNVIERRNPRHEEMQQRKGQGLPLNQSTDTILKDLTNAVYDLNDSATGELKNVFNELKKYIEKAFPGIEGLGFEQRTL